MIELLAHRETIPYAMAVAAICLSAAMGYMLGHQDESDLCGVHMVQAEQQTQRASELNDKLTTCEATKAGGSVLACAPICAQRVREALRNHTDIVCED